VEATAGTRVDVHPLRGLTKRADLIYHDGPILSVMENASGEPYLFLWCDADDQLNRWLAFRITADQLMGYTERRQALRAVLGEAPDGFVYLVDIDSSLKFQAVYALPQAELPEAYRPSEDSRYEFEPKALDIDLRSMSRHSGTPLLDLHVREGRGVRFGTIDISTLGPLLTTTGGLAEAVATSIHHRRETSTSGTKTDARSFGVFEFASYRAASFSVILRPTTTQMSLDGFSDRSDEVVRALQRLLDDGVHYEKLHSASLEFDDAVMARFQEFLTAVEEKAVNLDVRWAPSPGASPTTSHVDAARSRTILNNFARLDHEESEESWIEGRFTKLDTKYRACRFMSIARRETSGTIDARAEYPITLLNFSAEYRVFVRRRSVVLGGRKKPKAEVTFLRIEPIERP
jgi:hypothetical protein